LTEQFKKTWRGWVRSSDGYAIRITGRTGITYRDGGGDIHIDSEAMSSPWNEVVVYTRSIPDTPRRPRSEVVSRLGRAFKFLGWRLTLDDAPAEPT